MWRFAKAYENRYTWKNDFNGYQGKCTCLINNKNIYKGNYVLGKDFEPHIQKIDNDKIVKSIASQLFKVCIHRVKEFDFVHSENNFNLLKSSESGIEIYVCGKNEGDKYGVKNDCINMVYRKIHGTIIEIFVEEFFDTGIGFLSKKYTSQQIDPDT